MLITVDLLDPGLIRSALLERKRTFRSTILSTPTFIIWHASILAFATSHSLYWSLAILVVTGGAWASTQVFMLSVFLGTTQSEYRGRVIGLRSLAIYAFALGSMTSGAMAGVWGAPWAATVVGTMGIVLVVTLYLFTPKLRRF